MKFGPQAIRKPHRYSGSPRQCFSLHPDPPSPPWSLAKCFQTRQEHSHVLLKAPAVMVVHSGFYEIWLLGQSNFGATETSAQVCWRLREQLRPRHNLSRTLGAVFSHQWFVWFHNHKAFHWSYWSLYSYKICYIIIWQVLSKSLYIDSYQDTGITEMDSATGSNYLWDPGVDRDYLIIRNSHSVFPCSWSHALLPSFLDLCNLCWSSHTVFKHS